MQLIVLLAATAAAFWLSLGGFASAQPRGSYLESCANVHQRGPILLALCRDLAGRLREAQLDLRVCSGGNIENLDGRLVCQRGDGGRSRFSDDRDDERPGPPRGGRGERFGRDFDDERPGPPRGGRGERFDGAFDDERPGARRDGRGDRFDDNFRVNPGRRAESRQCEELRLACENRDRLGERGEGNCRRYREFCRGDDTFRDDRPRRERF